MEPERVEIQASTASRSFRASNKVRRVGKGRGLNSGLAHPAKVLTFGRDGCQGEPIWVVFRCLNDGGIDSRRSAGQALRIALAGRGGCRNEIGVSKQHQQGLGGSYGARNPGSGGQ